MEQFVHWINVPLFHVGATPVTFGGIGGALTIIFCSFIASSIIQKFLTKHLDRKANLDPSIKFALRRITHYLILVLGVVLGVQCIGLNFGTLAVAFGFLGVGIGFGLQNVTSNFISGLILLLERPIGIGDFVTVDDQLGEIVQINMRSTLIRTLDNVSIIVPNSKFIENNVVNWTYGDPRIRLHCPVGVAYGSDVELVRDTLMSVAKNHEGVLDTPLPEVRFLEFGDSSLNFALLVWTDNPKKKFLLHSKINFEIDKAFRKAGIQIPFPQRDLHIKPSPVWDQLIRSRSDQS